MEDVQISIFTELCKNPSDHKTTGLPPVFYWNCPPLSMGQMPRLVAGGLHHGQLIAIVADVVRCFWEDIAENFLCGLLVTEYLISR